MLYTLKTEDNKYIKLNDWDTSYHDEFIINNCEYYYAEKMAKYVSNEKKVKVYISSVELKYAGVISPQLTFQDLKVGDLFYFDSCQKHIKTTESQYICVEGNFLHRIYSIVDREGSEVILVERER